MRWGVVRWLPNSTAEPLPHTPVVPNQTSQHGAPRAQTALPIRRASAREAGRRHPARWLLSCLVIRAPSVHGDSRGGMTGGCAGPRLRVQEAPQINSTTQDNINISPDPALRRLIEGASAVAVLLGGASCLKAWCGVGLAIGGVRLFAVLVCRGLPPVHPPTSRQQNRSTPGSTIALETHTGHRRIERPSISVQKTKSIDPGHQLLHLARRVPGRAGSTPGPQ